MKKIMMSPLLMTAVLFADEHGAEEAASDGGLGTSTCLGIAAVAVIASLWMRNN